MLELSFVYFAILQLMGTIVLGCSIWAFYDGKTFARLIEEGAAEFDKPISLEIYRTSSVLLMIASVIIILIAFFGCCGAIKVRTKIS